MDNGKEFSITSKENKKKRTRWCNDDVVVDDDDYKYDDVGGDDDGDVGDDDGMMMPLIPIGSSSSVGNQTNIDNLAQLPSVEVSTGGTARKQGTTVGAVDIGIGKCAYFFQVALPGVKKDPGELRCEIERDGKVEIRGVTSTGGEVVTRNSRTFVMKYRQERTPPGPFTISFALPGPVDPRLFFPIFRSDGILEAVIAKL